MKKFQLLILALGISISVFAQENNPIVTTASFLNIAPDSRGSAMGDAGVATSSDVYSQYWNPAKYPFTKEEFGFGLSYTPWLRNLVGDIGLVDVTGFYRFDDVQTISSSLRYFSLGEINGTGPDGEPTATIKPNEFAFDIGYSRKFSDNWGGALVFRYIRSDLFSGAPVDGVEPGNSLAVDMAAYYRKEGVYVGGYESNYSFGVNVSNIGQKMTYNGTDFLYLPANLKLGGAYEMAIDDYNSIGFTMDFNKLLVPTPSLNDSINKERRDYGSLKGAFSSFGDAEGGFSEELHEIMVSVGLEYTYDQSFSVRGGYFYEHETKGNRKFLSVGAGFKMNVFALDVSYLVPTTVDSPLANTLRFSLIFSVDGLQSMFGN